MNLTMSCMIGLRCHINVRHTVTSLREWTIILSWKSDVLHWVACSKVVVEGRSCELFGNSHFRISLKRGKLETLASTSVCLLQNCSFASWIGLWTSSSRVLFRGALRSFSESTYSELLFGSEASQIHCRSRLRIEETLVRAVSKWWAHCHVSSTYQVRPPIVFLPGGLGERRFECRVGHWVASMPSVHRRHSCSREPPPSNRDLTGLAASSCALSYRWASEGSSLRIAVGCCWLSSKMRRIQCHLWHARD